MEELEELNVKKKPTPNIVKVLAILNYIVLGVSVLGIMLNLGQFMLSQNAFNDFGSEAYYAVLIMMSILIMVLIFSFYGALVMHKGRKRGFYFYIPGVALIGLLALYATSMPPPPSFKIAAGIITAVAFLFITIFATQLKKLS